MIVLYDTTETKFTSNGLGLLDHDIINPIIEESANGTFKLSFDYPLSGICGSRIGRRMYVKADDPDTEGNIFKIYNIEKSDGMLSVVAFQVANEFNNNWIEHTNIMGKNGQSALDQMKSNLTNSTRFNFYSDIDSTANSEIVRLNPLTWLIDSSTDNSFVNRWGGEIKRDGFNIRMFKQRGSNNGVQIRWRKNLSSYNVKWDDTTVVTRIRPVGYNGLTLPELYVDSPKLVDYGDPIIKEIKYDSVKVADENSSSDDNTYKTVDEAYTALRKLAAKEFNENHIDDPTVTADVSMISLKNTREYADVAELETIKQWDTIQLINERDNIDIQMRLNSYKYNSLNHEFTELKFVSVNQSLTSNTSFSSIINGIVSTVQSVSDTAHQAQIAANGKNMIQRGDANPNDLTFNGTLTDGDIYWRSNGNKTEMWIYSAKDKAWGLVVDDATGIKADQAQATADGKNTISYTDTAPANPKVNDVWFEEKSDGTIITNIWNGTKWEAPTSSEVKQTQVDLESKIAEAQADVNKKIANTQANLDKAKQNSDQLISDAQTELNAQADELKDVKQNAEEALNKSNGNSSSITDINADINKINGSLTIKADKSDIDAVNKTVLSQQNQITTNTEGLQLKADKTSVDTLSQTVTNQTAQISVLNDEVAEKTAKTDFDALTGRVTSAEQKVTANADGLNSTVSKMSTLQDQVNNSAVGTNLISGSTLEKNWYAQSPATASLDAINFVTFTKSTTSSARQGYMHNIQLGFLTSQYYTLSAEIYIVNVSGSGTDNDIHFRSYDSNLNATGNYAVSLDTSKVSVWQKLVVTGKTPADVSGGLDFGLSISGGITGVFKIRNFKLELGSVATDYSANPADNATVTAVTNISQKADQIAANLATSNGDITQLKAKATGWDSSIASANGKINTLQATSDGYATNISKIQDQVNNSAVGTNLLLNTTSFDRSDTSNFLGKWNYDPNKSGLDRGGNMVINMLNDTSGYSDVTQFINADPLTDYMYSIRLIWSQNNSTHGNFATLIAVEYKDSNMNLTDVYSDHELIIGNSVDVNKTSMHFKTQADCKYIKFYIRAFYGWYIAFTKPKVEKGTTATDYSTNPADNATVTSVTNAQNTAITESKTYADNQISATASTLSANLTSTTTTLKTYADNSATTKANVVQNNLDNLQVGGNNLIPLGNISTAASTQTAYDSSTDIRTFTIANGAGGSWGGGIQNNASVKHEIPWNAYFTYSVEIMPLVSGLHWNSDTNSFPISGSNWNNNDNDTGRVVNDNTGTTDKTLIPNVWNKVWVTYRNASTANTNKLSLYDNSTVCVVNNSGSTVTVKFRHFQGEIGNKPTDWSLAVEDIQNYADAQANNAKNTAISTAASDATTKANNAQNNAVSQSKTYTDTQISATAGTFNVKTSSIQTQLDNSAVGTNLLLASGSMDYIGSNDAGLKKWSYDSSKVSVNNGLVHVDMSTATSGSTDTRQLVKVSPSTTYNMSVQLRYAKASATHGQFVTLYAVEFKDAGSSTTANYNDHNFIIGNSDQRKYTNTSFTTQPDCQYVVFYVRVFYGYVVNFEQPKLELGSSMTDWSLAPTDTDYTNMFSMDSNGITLDAHGVNNSNKTILLRGDHVKIDSSNPVFIPNVNANVITSGTLDASKITVNKLSANSITSGTLNAANVNVINLNANNITSGTLTGVAFHQKSSDMETWIDNNGIHNWDDSGNNVWIKEGGFKIYNSSDEGIFMKGGQLTLTDLDTWGTIATIGTNKKPPTDSYGIIDSKLDIGLSGIRVHGGGGAALLRDSASGGGQTADVTTIGYWGISNGGGFSATNFLAQMGGDTSWVAAIQAGSRYGSYITSQPSIVVGTANWADTITNDTNVGPNTVISSGGIWLNSGGGVIVNAPSNFEVRSGGIIATAGGSHIRNTQIDNELWVNGTLNVSGAKNAIVKTTKGWTQINAYETAENYFGDLAKVNTGSGSKVKIMMDKLFLETVNTKVDYHVFVSSYGNGYAWVSEQGRDYFIIESNVPDLKVGYEIKAKRLGYESNRLEIDKDFEDKFETEKGA